MKPIGKLIISVLTVLLLSLCIANGQSKKNEIQDTFKKYFETIKKQQNDLTLKYIYPQYFEYVSKESTVKFWKASQNDPYNRKTFDNPKIIEVSDILKIKDKDYALIKFLYQLNIKYVIPDAIKNSGEKNISDYLKVMEGSYQNLYGKDNVRHEKKSNTFDITVYSQLYAIKNQSEKDWKLLYKEDYIEETLKKILPKEVLSLK